MALNPVAPTDAAKVDSQTAAIHALQIQSAAKELTPAKTQPAATDSVQISTAAHEAAETAAQTAQEASRGDRQAQRLLAKEAAAKAALQGNNQSSILRP